MRQFYKLALLAMVLVGLFTQASSAHASQIISEESVVQVATDRETGNDVTIAIAVTRGQTTATVTVTVSNCPSKKPAVTISVPVLSSANAVTQNGSRVSISVAGLRQNGVYTVIARGCGAVASTAIPAWKAPAVRNRAG